MKIDVINMIATPIALAIVLKRRAFSGMKSFPGKLSSRVSARLQRRQKVSEPAVVRPTETPLKRRTLSGEAET